LRSTSLTSHAAGHPLLPAGSKSRYCALLDGGDRLTGSQRLRRASWAIWLAVLALGLEALVPVHLALDLDEALGVTTHRVAAGASQHGFEWRLWALVTGHDTGDGRPDGDRHHLICPAVTALGALGGFAAVAPPALPAPIAMVVPLALSATAGAPRCAPAAAYRSRAPPLG
jgi:hypothetical protein